MKKFLKLFTMLLLGALVMSGTATFYSCDKFKDELKSTPDSAQFVEMVAKALPAAMQQMYTFNDVTDVMSYRLERQRQAQYDSVFSSISDQTIANIVSVLSKSKSNYTISDIVNEYSMNRRVYDGLPDADKQPDPPLIEETVEFAALTTPDTVKKE